MKPPMCLQYAIWTLASNGHEQYGHLHDIFYQRARSYAEADELKVWLARSHGPARFLLLTVPGARRAFHHNTTCPSVVSNHY